MTVHIHQRFHAVGHGTFATGLVRSDPPHNSGDDFSWVYDCGSKRHKALNNHIKYLGQTNTWPKPIDMVVLSHFDDDHVNNLEKLLLEKSTRWLVLPFSEWQQRVRDACVGGSKGISASTAHLQLDPIGWLRSHNLLERVSRLLLIRGSADPDSDGAPIDPSPLPDGPEQWSEDQIHRQPNVVTEISSEDVSIGATPSKNHLRVHILNHKFAIRADSLPVEFMFYNAEIPGTALGIIQSDENGELIAAKSGDKLTDARKEIENLIQAIGLHKSVSALPSKWREQLKACYQTHFGSTPKGKNNISLCLYVRPLLTNSRIKACNLFLAEKADPKKNDHRVAENFDPLRPATLYTGDLTMDKDVISAMTSHFGSYRWAQIGLTQVPHHGSEHSWSKGNALLLKDSAFVHCAPGTSAHPHHDVVTDLEKSVVFTADYENSVTLDYHF